jgi:hypothetical protein
MLGRELWPCSTSLRLGARNENNDLADEGASFVCLTNIPGNHCDIIEEIDCN